MTLSEQIKRAFADVPYPGDDHITFSQCEESQHVLHYLQGRKWDEITVQELRYANALGWLSEAGFHYYLPAHLLAVITDVATADVLVDGLRYAFLPPRRQTGTAGMDSSKRLQILSASQKEAIILTFQKLANDGVYDAVDVEMLRNTFAHCHQKP